MNATSLYVSTCRLILQAQVEDTASWTDLFRLLPYLRQSLSCTVCGNLLIEPYTPTETNCQHHVCKSCKGGKKKLKPSCSWCKDYEKYIENVQLRILLQCYKKLCVYIRSTSIFKNLGSINPPANNSNTNLLDGTTPSLTNLIQEGVGFADEFQSLASRRSNNVGLLPCVVTNTASTQTNLASTPSPQPADYLEPNITSNEGQDTIESPKTSNEISSIYSVLYAGSGNKLTIKRKASEPLGLSESKNPSNQLKIVVPPVRLDLHKTKAVKSPPILPPPVKKQSRGRSNSTAAVKSGCRCGNATATPGKLTCCGQRCACYTESKPCVDCKCRGCRNPHIADGQKVVPPLDSLQDFQLTTDQNEKTGPQSLTLSPNEIVTTAGGTIQVVGVYTTQLHDVSSATSPVLLDANTKVTCSVNSEEEPSDAYVESHL